jgi:hypothetical protein
MAHQPSPLNQKGERDLSRRALADTPDNGAYPLWPVSGDLAIGPTAWSRFG